MKLIQKIKDIIFKVKDYGRLEHDYSSVLDYATGGILSKTNYTLDSVYEVIQYHLQKYDKYVFMDFMEKAERWFYVMSPNLIEDFKRYMKDEYLPPKEHNTSGTNERSTE